MGNPCTHVSSMYTGRNHPAVKSQSIIEQYYNLNPPEMQNGNPGKHGQPVRKRHADCGTQRFQNIAVRKNSMYTAHFGTKLTSWYESIQTKDQMQRRTEVKRSLLKIGINTQSPRWQSVMASMLVLLLAFLLFFVCR
jgi:hypothetical protein